MALTAEGATYAWGSNRCGQLGTGNFIDALTPQRILSSYSIVDVAVGAEHTLALASDGTLLAFGCNARGALGIGAANLGEHATPKPVPTTETFTAIAAAGGHSVGLTAEGSVYTWGANNQGQLGASRAALRDELVRATNGTDDASDEQDSVDAYHQAGRDVIRA